jgi:hypothetical protein
LGTSPCLLPIAPKVKWLPLDVWALTLIILHALPATCSNFPMKYLGIPLSFTRLKRNHFQPLEDKLPSLSLGSGSRLPWPAVQHL